VVAIWGMVLMKAVESEPLHDMKAAVEIELIRLIIHNNDGKIAEAIESAAVVSSKQRKHCRMRRVAGVR